MWRIYSGPFFSLFLKRKWSKTEFFSLLVFFKKFYFLSREFLFSCPQGEILSHCWDSGVIWSKGTAIYNVEPALLKFLPSLLVTNLAHDVSKTSFVHFSYEVRKKRSINTNFALFVRRFCERIFLWIFFLIFLRGRWWGICILFFVRLNIDFILTL